MNRHPEGDRAEPRHGQQGFRLFRYFTATGLAAFCAVAIVLFLLEWKESSYFRQVQTEQSGFVARLQNDFVRDYDERARRDLLAVHEAGHVSLTRVLANALWNSHLAPFVSVAEKIAIGDCRAAAPEASAACLKQVGASIQALPQFRALDAKLAEAARGSSVFKVKVFDSRGITLYSSEHGQIGEDKRDNQGWQQAIAGRPASELTRRDTFSAFEGVVENRDLISSYVPMFVPGGGERGAGVFEIYSDVTPLLQRIAAGTSQLAEQSRGTQEKLAGVAAANQKKVESNAYALLAVVLGLLALLYVALLLIVLRAQRILDAQARAREEWIARESHWHREKMAALATMAASIAHEVGNPLSVIAGIAEDMAARSPVAEPGKRDPEVILEQTQRIAEKTRQMADFAARHSDTPELVDLNGIVKAICEFLAFDQRFSATRIDLRLSAGLPAPIVVPDRLTEALMSLMQAYVEETIGHQRAPRSIVVETFQRERYAVIRVTCEPAPEPAVTDLALQSIARGVSSMGGLLTHSGAVTELALPFATEVSG